MNKWTLKTLAAAALGVIALAGQANAAVTYSYGSDLAQYDAAPGTVVNVKLYLLETLDGASTSVISADGGVQGVALKVAKTSSTGDGTVGAVTFNVAEFGGPTGTTGASATGVKLSENIAPAAGTPGVVPGNNGGNAANAKPQAVYLGTVAITAGALPTTYTLTPYDNLGGNTLTLNSFYDLDTDSTNPAYSGASGHPTSFTVGVVPEPTFIGMAVVGAFGAFVRRRRTA